MNTEIRNYFLNKLLTLSVNQVIEIKNKNLQQLSEISLKIKSENKTNEKLRIKMFKCYEILAWIDYMFITNSFKN